MECSIGDRDAGETELCGGGIGRRYVIGVG